MVDDDGGAAEPSKVITRELGYINWFPVLFLSCALSGHLGPSTWQCAAMFAARWRLVIWFSFE